MLLSQSKYEVDRSLLSNALVLTTISAEKKYVLYLGMLELLINTRLGGPPCYLKNIKGLRYRETHEITGNDGTH